MKRKTFQIVTMAIAALWLLPFMAGAIVIQQSSALATQNNSAGKVNEYSENICTDNAQAEIELKIDNIRSATLGENDRYQYHLYWRKEEIATDGSGEIITTLINIKTIDQNTESLVYTFSLSEFPDITLPATFILKRGVLENNLIWIESEGQGMFSIFENVYIVNIERHCINELPITGTYTYYDGRQETYTFHLAGEDGDDDKLEYTFYDRTADGCVKEYKVVCQLSDIPQVVVDEIGDVCQDNEQLLINYFITHGNPTNCHITFNTEAYNAGFKDLDIELDGTNTINIPLVSQYGEYGINLQFYDNSSIEACQSNVYSQQFFITLGGFVHEKWDDVLFVDNNDKNCSPDCDNDLKFKAYQWYKNGKALDGETDQYYYEEGGLNGVYYVVLTDTAGNEYRSCEIERRLTIDENGQVVPLRIAPVPADAGQRITIDTDKNGIFYIYDMTGRTISCATKHTEEFSLTAPQKAGAYVVTFKDEAGTIESVKLIVK